MSTDSHQRKQELLGRLALSRLEIIGEAENVGAKVDQAISLPARLGHVVKQHPGISASVGVGAGLVLVKLVMSLFHSDRKSHHHGMLSDIAKPGLIKVAFGSVWGMILASATPIIRNWIHDRVSEKLNKTFSSKG